MINTVQKIMLLLTTKERKRALVMVCLMFVTMVLETMGIGLIIPTLAIFMQPEFFSNYPIIKSLVVFLGNPSQEQLIVGMLLFLVLVYLAKSLILAFSLWWQMRFVYDFQASLSGRIFRSYLMQSYSFHLNRNSAQLLRNAVTEVAEFNSRVLVPGTQLIGELLIVFGIVCLLLAVQPLAAVVTFCVLIALSWAFYFIIRSRLVEWGEARQVNEGLRIQHIQQGLGAIKDVKLLGREEEFFRKFDVNNKITAAMARNRATVVELPRLWLEVVAIIGLAALVIVMLSQEKSTEVILPFLGLFAVASFRLLPSANRILGSIQSLRFGLPIIETLNSELTTAENIRDPAINQVSNRSNIDFLSEISVMKINYAYPETSSQVLKNLSIKIKRGESVGFIGESGSGKSTMVDVLLGLLLPTSGHVMVDGKNIHSDLAAWQSKLGYVPQSIYLTDDTLRNNVALGLEGDEVDEEAITRSIQAAQLDSFVRDLPEGLDTFVGERGVRLSGGQRQRIGIARALYNDPAVLVLDEATSALDSETEQGVMMSVDKLHGEKTIIIVAHRMSTLAGCDTIFRLDNGEIVQKGKYKEVVGG